LEKIIDGSTMTIIQNGECSPEAKILLGTDKKSIRIGSLRIGLDDAGDSPELLTIALPNQRQARFLPSMFFRRCRLNLVSPKGQKQFEAGLLKISAVSKVVYSVKKRGVYKILASRSLVHKTLDILLAIKKGSKARFVFDKKLVVSVNFTGKKFIFFQKTLT